MDSAYLYIASLLRTWWHGHARMARSLPGIAWRLRCILTTLHSQQSAEAKVKNCGNLTLLTAYSAYADWQGSPPRLTAPNAVGWVSEPSPGNVTNLVPAFVG
jgi:hypothetical protein